MLVFVLFLYYDSFMMKKQDIINKNIPPAETEDFVGIGSRVCSKNSSICGLIMVSSGMLCKVIQANNEAFLIKPFLD